MKKLVFTLTIIFLGCINLANSAPQRGGSEDGSGSSQNNGKSTSGDVFTACMNCSDLTIRRIIQSAFNKQYAQIGCGNRSVCSGDSGNIFTTRWVIYTGQGEKNGKIFHANMSNYQKISIVEITNQTKSNELQYFNSLKLLNDDLPDIRNQIQLKLDALVNEQSFYQKIISSDNSGSTYFSKSLSDCKTSDFSSSLSYFSPGIKQQISATLYSALQSVLPKVIAYLQSINASVAAGEQISLSDISTNFGASMGGQVIFESGFSALSINTPNGTLRFSVTPHGNVPVASINLNLSNIASGVSDGNSELVHGNLPLSSWMHLDSNGQPTFSTSGQGVGSSIIVNPCLQQDLEEALSSLGFDTSSPNRGFAGFKDMKCTNQTYSSEDQTISWAEVHTLTRWRDDGSVSFVPTLIDRMVNLDTTSAVNQSTRNCMGR